MFPLVPAVLFAVVILYFNYHHGVWVLVAITGISELFCAIVNTQKRIAWQIFPIMVEL